MEYIGAKTPHVTCLSAQDAFETLDERERLYAHYSARAAWLGTRIILSQVSPEAVHIFDFILELYQVCAGKWVELQEKCQVSTDGMTGFLEYAALFLHNIGNYYGHGDQKFVPNTTQEVLARLSHASPFATSLYMKLAPYVQDAQPERLGFTTSSSQTQYYIGEPITQEELKVVSDFMEKHQVLPENTRVRKFINLGEHCYEILCASQRDTGTVTTFNEGDRVRIRVLYGDHTRDLDHVCKALESALQYTSNSAQFAYMSNLLSSLSTGDMQHYMEAQKLWVRDVDPRVETILGFVEPYRDPLGMRAEFEGIVGIVHERETQVLSSLVEKADNFIVSLPWVRCSEAGNGPFETDTIGHRTFTSLHTLAYCSSLVFPGINLPNYNDIREKIGYKNILITNSMDAASMSGDSGATYIQSQESKQYLSLRRQTYYLWVVFHELFGHGTGKLLAETDVGVYNFDFQNPPVNLVTGEPITSWYSLHQTWTGVFGDIAASVDECRAECIGAILFGNTELMELFGFTQTSEVTASDLEYNFYLLVGVAGLRSLEDYSPVEKKWGQAHSRAHFAMFRTLLERGHGVMTVQHDVSSKALTIVVERSKVVSHGRLVLEDFAMRLHMFRCTADAAGCRAFYEEITQVEGSYLSWLVIVVASKPPSRIFVQPNTFLDGNDVTLKEYPPSCEGMIQSWAERCV